MFELAVVNKIQELTAWKCFRSSVFPLRSLRLRTELAIQRWSRLWCQSPTNHLNVLWPYKEGENFSGPLIVWWCAWGYSLIPRTKLHVVSSLIFPMQFHFWAGLFSKQYQLRRVLGVWTVPAWTHCTLGTIPLQKLCREIHHSVSLDCGNKYPVKERQALSALKTCLKSKERWWSSKTKWSREASRVAEAWRSRGKILNFQISPCPATSLASSW